MQIKYSPPSLAHAYPTGEKKFSAYVALNAKTPFLHFAHLTATQALLEALTEDGDELFLHIVDVDIAGFKGAQWPCFLQALADKRCEEGCSIKRVRITGIGKDLSTLEYTGSHLLKFAQSCHLPFEFVPLVQDLETLTPDMLGIQEGEVVGVNCVMQLHTLLTRGPEMLTNFLSMLESLAPTVVTLAEGDASLNSPYFLDRFRNAWNFYSLLFDALDATLPASSRERAQIEQEWYRAEILNVVAFEGPERFVRHQSSYLWKKFFQGNGFEILAPSRATLSQAQCLLKMCHPEGGYRIEEKEGSVALGWRDETLFTVSAWRMAEMEE
ncbi:hypothetical protein M758_5G108800 [Ceratodon purpureus]|nr:hypothetical protein M758_5G108800 [Ceratodon purpureus]